MLCLPGCPISKPDHQTHVQFHSCPTQTTKKNTTPGLPSSTWILIWCKIISLKKTVQMHNNNNSFACPSWSIGAPMPWTIAVWRFGKLHDPPAKLTRSQGSRQKRASHLSAAAWSSAGLWARPGGEEDDGPNGSMGKIDPLVGWYNLD